MARYIDADALYVEVTERYRDITAGSYPFNIVAYDMARLVENAPTVDAVEVVHCEHCTIKKAVQHKDGIVWRCPHRTGDVKMEGYCESGVRVNEDLGTS